MAEKLRTIQFRDLRAKAATDIEAPEKAQKLLGHTKRDMTEHYVRKRRGESPASEMKMASEIAGHFVEQIANCRTAYIRTST